MPFLRDNPLRVALFSGNYNCVRDGANQALNRLVHYLINVEGADVRIYSPVVDKSAFEPIGELVGVPSIAIPGRKEYRIAMGLPGAIRKDILDFAPDVVHLSAPDWLGSAAQRLAQKQGWPVVTSVHTRFESYFSYYGLQALKPVAENWMRHFYRNSDIVLVPNQAMVEEFRNSVLCSDVRLWGRGVDHGQFSPSARDPQWRHSVGIGDDEVVVLFFGRLVLEKGLGVYADTIQELRQRGVSIRPLIVGDGPARSKLTHDLPDAVYTGHLMGSELARAVASADILLNPSLTEAFGNVTLEAMACGLAVICPDVPSANNLIESGRTGVLTDGVSIPGFADAIEALAGRTGLRHKVGHAAAHASLSYSWDNANLAVANAYRAVLGSQMAYEAAS